MKISIIGTNGLLSDSIGRFCNKNNISLDMYGLFAPEHHICDNFYCVNLIDEELPYEIIKRSDIIIYAVGAGIQSNLKESFDIIYTLNVTIPVRVVNSLKQVGYSGTFVTFGSYFEIGENSENKLFLETDLLQSQNKVLNDYSVSKRMLSRFMTSAETVFRTWHFILPTIYGEQEAPHRLIPYTINAIKSNSTIEFTSGDQIRQYIYIDEIADILLCAYDENLSSGVYNIAGTETLTVKELVTALFSKFDTVLPDSVFGKAQRVDTGMKILQLNGDKLASAIKFKPTIKILDVYDRY